MTDKKNLLQQNEEKKPFTYGQFESVRMIFDQYSNELAPGEMSAVDECLPDIKIETLPNAWYPNAFVVKPYAR